MIFDTHCHLDSSVFDDDREGVYERASLAGVTYFVNPAYDLLSSRRAIDLAHSHQNVYAAVGVHPNDIASLTDSSLAQLHAMSSDNRVVAIGEIGLDYYWKTHTPAAQAEAFQRQLHLAHAVGLPVIIHCREAYDDVLDMLGNAPHLVNIVLHAFAGTGAHAERALSAGYYLGIGGPVTFKKAVSLRDMVREAPRSQILLETDAPYLAPTPHRGKRNEPAFIALTLETVADLWRVSALETATITLENACTCFNVKF